METVDTYIIQGLIFIFRDPRKDCLLLIVLQIRKNLIRSGCDNIYADSILIKVMRICKVFRPV